MNILPKKRWHVRTKENIARVRKDEAEAAEKERQEKLRVENADREARLSILKHKSKQKLQDAGITKPTLEAAPVTKHINFFADLEHAVKTTNKEHDTEVKDKKEDYEKKIGYLTYLGQDTNEVLGKKNWYEVAPGCSRSTDIKDTYEKLVLKDEDGKPRVKQLDLKNGEIGWKSKQKLDPINTFNKYCHKNIDIKPPEKNLLKEKATKMCIFSCSKHKLKSKDEKKEKLLKLREMRLKREREEKCRTDIFLSKLNGQPEPDTSATNIKMKTTLKPKYNSQFNPELARQNYK